MNPITQTKEVIEQMIAFIEASPWRADYLERLQSLKVQTDQPCVLAIAGRVKAGKSSFLNALLGKDLAKVGITETTATINIFRYGTPQDPQRPVKVVWSNGRETWEDKEFLDSLQGNDKATLQRAEGIAHLEFVLPDDILKDVTLVDTPGTDAIVGENGDEHQRVTEEFFHLRQRHNQETKEQTDRADAVIYLIGQVANISGQGFMQEFQAATSGQSSAINAIGVMAKVDIQPVIMEQRNELAKNIADKMQHELNTVVPVSAGIWRALDLLRQQNRLQWMQQTLRTLPEDAFEYMFEDEDAYLSTGGFLQKIFQKKERVPLPIELRLELKGDLPWRVFVVISEHLYRYPLDEAIEKLTEIAGVNRVMTIIRSHFFERGRLLRCFRIVGSLNTLLRDISRNKLYTLKQQVAALSEFEEFIETHPRTRNNRTTSDKLLQFLKQHIKTEAEFKQIKHQVEVDLIAVVEKLQLQLDRTNNHFTALQLIEQNRKLFTNQECEELFRLFGMYGSESQAIDNATRAERQQHWNLEINMTRSRDRQKVAQFAITEYGTV